MGAWGVESADPGICDARLSLHSADPLDMWETAKTTVFWHPFRGNRVSLFNGSVWRCYSLASIKSVAVPSTTDTPFDIFAYESSGVVSLETCNWSSATARATELAYQNGVLVKSGIATRRYLGTGCTTGVSGQCEDTSGKRFLINYYHRVRKSLYIQTTGGSHQYDGAKRYWANDSSYVCYYVMPTEFENPMSLFLRGSLYIVDPADVGTLSNIILGFDGTGANSLLELYSYTDQRFVRSAATFWGGGTGFYGRHFLALAQESVENTEFVSASLTGWIEG